MMAVGGIWANLGTGLAQGALNIVVLSTSSRDQPDFSLNVP